MELLLSSVKCWNIVQGLEKPPIDPRLPQSNENSTPTPDDEGNERESVAARNRSRAPNATAIKQYEEKLDDYNTRFSRAASLINSSLSNRVRAYVVGKKKPNEMWTTLKTRLDKATRGIGANHLRSQFQEDKLKDNESVSDYIGRLLNIQERLQFTEQPISDAVLVWQVLHKLTSTPKFAGIVRHIKDRPISDQTIDYVLDTLLDHEEQEAESAGQKTVEAQAFAAQQKFNKKRFHPYNRNNDRSNNRHRNNNNRNNNNRNNNNRNRNNRNNRNNDHNQDDSDDRGKGRCWHCLRRGHKIDNCRTKKEADELQAQRGQQQNTQANIARAYKATAYTSYSRAALSQAQQTCWYADSGATDHMSSQYRAFSVLKRLSTPRDVMLGDNFIVKATGIGDITLNSSHGSITLNDVLYVPQLGCSLISISTLDIHGYRITFANRACSITLNDKLLLTAPLDKGMYRLPSVVGSQAMPARRRLRKQPKPVLPGQSAQPTQQPTQQPTEQPTQIPSITAFSDDLWHARLGHLNKPAVRLLANGLATGINVQRRKNEAGGPEQPCVPCLQGK